MGLSKQNEISETNMHIIYIWRKLLLLIFATHTWRLISFTIRDKEYDEKPHKWEKFINGLVSWHKGKLCAKQSLFTIDEQTP